MTERSHISFGEQMKLMREERELTVREAAELAEVDASTVSRIENNLSEPVLSSIWGLAYAYDLVIVVRPQGIFVRNQ